MMDEQFTAKLYADAATSTSLVPVCLRPGSAEIWCKLEFLNPSGSTKDRIARFILAQAFKTGRLRSGQTIVEASSGSTSIAFALACARLKIPFTAIMPEGISDERVTIIRAYGGTVCLTPRDLGIHGAIAEAERLGSDPRYFFTRQFSNPDNILAHRHGTAREIATQLPNTRTLAVVSGVGTGGTLMGLYAGLRDAGHTVTPIVARPVNLGRNLGAECCSFSTRIPGVVDQISTLFNEAELSGLETIEVSDDEALATTRALIQSGYPVGPSSGLNYRAAEIAAERFAGAEMTILTVFPDRMERYFTTELLRPYSAPLA